MNSTYAVDIGNDDSYLSMVDSMANKHLISIVEYKNGQNSTRSNLSSERFLELQNGYENEIRKAYLGIEGYSGLSSVYLTDLFENGDEIGLGFLMKNWVIFFLVFLLLIFIAICCCILFHRSASYG